MFGGSASAGNGQKVENWKIRKIGKNAKNIFRNNIWGSYFYIVHHFTQFLHHFAQFYTILHHFTPFPRTDSSSFVGLAHVLGSVTEELDQLALLLRVPNPEERLHPAVS